MTMFVSNLVDGITWKKLHRLFSSQFTSKTKVCKRRLANHVPCKL